MKTINLKQPFSRLPITQRVERITLTLLKAVLKFCTSNKLFEFENIHLKDLSQIRDVSII